MDNRRTARKPIIQRLSPYSVGSRRARNLKQLLLLPLTGDEAFDLGNRLLVNLLAVGREVEEGV